MYNIKFTLRQHTPLIHFQHEQAGATLRATEVKPKLDRFIIEQLRQVDPHFYNENKSIIDLHFSDNPDKHKPSLYKLQVHGKIKQKVLCFSLPNKKDEAIISANPNAKKIAGDNFDVSVETPLFSNNSFIKFGGKHPSDKFPDSKRFVKERDCQWDKVQVGVIYENVLLTIKSFDKKIFDIVVKCLPYVFAEENFGLRQSKGFGSFSIEGQSETHFAGLLNTDLLAIYKKEINEDWKGCLKGISNDWRFLKAGNSHGRYYKSDIMKYFCKRYGLRWEKRKTKKEIADKFPVVWNGIRCKVPHKIAGCILNPDNPKDVDMGKEKYAYVRALMGLAQFYEYGMTDFKNRLVVNIKERSGDVERFKSPVTFKVTDNAIYMLCYPIPGNLIKNNTLNRTYDFNMEATVGDKEYNKNICPLEIPANFSLTDFFESAWLGYNFEKSHQWNLPGAKTVAQHFNYKKLSTHEKV